MASHSSSVMINGARPVDTIQRIEFGDGMHSHNLFVLQQSQQRSAGGKQGDP